jgi:hypothetical protein
MLIDRAIFFVFGAVFCAILILGMWSLIHHVPV